MVKDVKNGECFRLDHLIKAQLEKAKSDKKATPEKKARCDEIIVQLEGMKKDQMKEVMDEFEMKSPITGNDLTEPLEFNLMFQTHIGPTGLMKGFLRPETAQGIFASPSGTWPNYFKISNCLYKRHQSACKHLKNLHFYFTLLPHCFSTSRQFNNVAKMVQTTIHYIIFLKKLKLRKILFEKNLVKMKII